MSDFDDPLARLIRKLWAKLEREPTEDEVYWFIHGDSAMRTLIANGDYNRLSNLAKGKTVLVLATNHQWVSEVTGIPLADVTQYYDDAVEAGEWNPILEVRSSHE